MERPDLYSPDLLLSTGPVAKRQQHLPLRLDPKKDQNFQSLQQSYSIRKRKPMVSPEKLEPCAVLNHVYTIPARNSLPLENTLARQLKSLTVDAARHPTGILNLHDRLPTDLLKP